MYELLRFIIVLPNDRPKKSGPTVRTFAGDDDDSTECGALIITCIGTLAILFHILNSQNTATKAGRERSTTKVGGLL
jgi:hypothetical protein